MAAQVAPTGAVSKLERRTIDDIETRVGEWLSSHVPACAGATVTGTTSSSSGGLSGDTHVVTMAPQPDSGGAEVVVVVRAQVREDTTNPQSRFDHLLKAQLALGELPHFPVPRVLGVELSGRVLGAPFLVTEFVPGDVPADVPSYAAQGWVKEASDEQRRRMWTSGIDALVAIHALDPEALGLGELRVQAPGDDEVERCMNDAVSLFRIEAKGASNPVIERAIRWLAADRPTPGRVCLSWGDARIGNIIWQDFTCAAVIDWEMSTLGSPGIDLGWWSFFHRWSTYGQGFPDLGGMPVGAELAQLYKARGGDSVPDFRYYEVLAAVRGLSIWLRTFGALRAQGALPEMDPLDDGIHMVRVLHSLMAEVVTHG